MTITPDELPITIGLFIIFSISLLAAVYGEGWYSLMVFFGLCRVLGLLFKHGKRVGTIVGYDDE